LRCCPDAPAAALELFERHDPGSLDQAVEVACGDGELPPAAFEIVIEAWDRFFHIRSMPWN
jgi:hypothetical protein